MQKSSIAGMRRRFATDDEASMRSLPRGFTLACVMLDSSSSISSSTRTARS